MIRTAIICVAIFFNAFSCYDISSECIASHNTARAIDSSPNIVYNSSVCIHAEKRAKELAQGCAFNHNGNSGSGYGENLGTGGQVGCAQSMNMWLAEKKIYCDEKLNGFDSRTGHYTQCVWKNSLSICCAQAQYSSTCKLPCTGCKYVTVCSYYKPGNYLGQFTQNVTPKC